MTLASNLLVCITVFIWVATISLSPDVNAYFDGKRNGHFKCVFKSSATKLAYIPSPLTTDEICSHAEEKKASISVNSKGIRAFVCAKCHQITSDPINQ